ncbi:MAG: glutamine-hydrolyzing GMP synthase [Christensenellales bacterium]|jgi:GMP synthase (glutamine-hydrolysing)
MNQTIVILDLGGAYAQRVARKVRECAVYSVIKPCTASPEEIRALNPIGIVLAGGAGSVDGAGAPACAREMLDLGVPTLGIGYGAQLICHMSGGAVAAPRQDEYGVYYIDLDGDTKMFGGLGGARKAHIDHPGRIARLPAGFRTTARAEHAPILAFEHAEKNIYGTLFHPEVESASDGRSVLRRFLYDICGARGDYGMESYLRREIARVREQVGDRRVLLGLSGGVDSSVCAALLSEAIGKQLVCVFIDHGFMRKGEPDEIKTVFAKRPINFVYVDARARFLARLAGVTDPEEKRKAIGEEFVRAFEDEALGHNSPEFLAQGTIYPDVIESGANDSALVKSHHNVGGLPETMRFSGIVEPLRGLFKDEVRKLGLLLKLPKKLVGRQPFPGPGLAIRVIGELTEQKLDLLRDADAIVREEIGRSRAKVDQYFAVLTANRSVGVTDDARTYDYTIAVRAVRTNDFMTCEYARLPHALLSRISERITGEVRGVNRVVYDITGKPPATIEWE